MFIYLWAGRADVSRQRASCGPEIEDTSEKEGDVGREGHSDDMMTSREFLQ